ncbi:MAG: hypothetical protein V7K54_22265 [Nostoc sp.]
MLHFFINKDEYSFSCLHDCNYSAVTKKVINPTETKKKNSQQLPKGSAKRVVALSSLFADIISRLDQTKVIGITGNKLFKNDSRFKDILRISKGQAILDNRIADFGLTLRLTSTSLRDAARSLLKSRGTLGTSRSVLTLSQGYGAINFRF